MNGTRGPWCVRVAMNMMMIAVTPIATMTPKSTHTDPLKPNMPLIIAPGHPDPSRYLAVLPGTYGMAGRS